jgi:hypothetical protein
MEDVNEDDVWRPESVNSRDDSESEVYRHVYYMNPDTVYQPTYGFPFLLPLYVQEQGTTYQRVVAETTDGSFVYQAHNGPSVEVWSVDYFSGQYTTDEQLRFRISFSIPINRELTLEDVNLSDGCVDAQLSLVDEPLTRYAMRPIKNLGPTYEVVCTAPQDDSSVSVTIESDIVEDVVGRGNSESNGFELVSSASVHTTRNMCQCATDVCACKFDYDAFAPGQPVELSIQTFAMDNVAVELSAGSGDQQFSTCYFCEPDDSRCVSERDIFSS